MLPPALITRVKQEDKLLSFIKISCYYIQSIERWNFFFFIVELIEFISFLDLLIVVHFSFIYHEREFSF